MISFPLPVPFDEFEWDNLILFLKTCPGRLASAIVPGEAAQTALIARLPPALNPLPVIVAPSNANSPALARLALDAGERDAVLIIPFITHADFLDDKDAQHFLESLNYQRERLAAKLVRTLFILTQQQDTFMLRFADDLRDWVQPFRFPEALPAPARELRAEMPAFASPLTANNHGAEIKLLQDQYRRARQSGMSTTEVLRDYAAPLFHELVKAGWRDEAMTLWNHDFGQGDALTMLKPKDRLPLLQDRSSLAAALAHLDEMDRWSQQYLHEAETEGASLHQASAWAARGDFFQRAFDWDRAINSFKQSMERYQALGDKTGEARVRKSIGAVQRFRDEYHTALQSHAQNRALYKHQDSRLGEADTLGAIGRIQTLQREFDAALRSYGQALALYQRLGDRRGEANTLVLIGGLQRLRNENEASLQSYGQALELHKQFGDRFGEAAILITIGDLQRFQDNYENALYCYAQALAIYELVRGQSNPPESVDDLLRLRQEINSVLHRYRPVFALLKDGCDRLGHALALYHQVCAHLSAADQNKTDESDRLLEQARSIFQGISDPFRIVARISNRGWALHNAREHERARTYFIRAAELFDELGLPDYAERHRKAAEG